MKTACLLFLVVPAAAQYVRKYDYKAVTSGDCNGPCDASPDGGAWRHVTTVDECEAAASYLRKLAQTISTSWVDQWGGSVYDSPERDLLLYCTYYPNMPDEYAWVFKYGTPGPDALGMLWRDNTGECSPDRECLCVKAYPSDDKDCGESDNLSDENISVIVILGLSFLWAGPITWFFKRRLYPPLGWERVRGRVRGPCERGHGSTDESTTRDHAGIVLQGGPGGINGRGGADRQGGSVAYDYDAWQTTVMPTAIATPGAATGSVAMPTVIATPGAAAAMPTVIAGAVVVQPSAYPQAVAQPYGGAAGYGQQPQDVVMGIVIS